MFCVQAISPMPIRAYIYTNCICNIGQHVRLGGGENPIDGELLPYGILSGGGGEGNSWGGPISPAVNCNIPEELFKL